MSLRGKLLRWLVIPLMLVNLAGATAIYWLAWLPAQAALDQSLADTAWAMVPHVQEAGNSVELQLTQQAEQVLRVDHFDEIFFVDRGTAFRRGQWIGATKTNLKLLRNMRSGLNGMLTTLHFNTLSTRTISVERQTVWSVVLVVLKSSVLLILLFMSARC